MATPGRNAIPPRATPRLYLVTPPVDDPAVCADDLASALKPADVAAVLMRLAPGDERSLINRAKAIGTIVQGALEASNVDLADNAVGQIVTRTSYAAAVKALHVQDEMWQSLLAAEAGDYVMFGEPDAAGYRHSFNAVLERVDWWAEVFEIPCVGFAASFDEVEALARAGADFVAVGDLVWRDARGPAAALAEAAQRLTVAEPVP